MRKIFFCAFTFFLFHSAHSQQIVDLQENTPYSFNGLEYGYYITNEASKEVKGEDYARYEVTLYVSNKSNCIKLIPFPNNPEQTSEQITIGEFSCRNATGKRLTSKGGTIAAKPWFTNVRIEEPGPQTRYRFIRAQVGFAIRSGQTITNKIIVIVPKGERPNFSCRPIYFPEINS